MVTVTVSMAPPLVISALFYDFASRAKEEEFGFLAAEAAGGG